MKPLVVILGLFVAAAAGAAGGMLVATPTVPVAADSAAVAKAAHDNALPSAPASAAAIESSGISEQVNQLSDEIARLQAELVALREGRVRESVAADSTTAKVADLPDDAFAVLHRDAILRVIDDDRKMQAKKAEDERKAREAELAQQRADRVAKELGLNTTQARALGEFYAIESDKRNEFFKDFRNGNMPADREQARTLFQEYRDWRTTELTSRLGADLATKVTELDGDRGGPGFAGGRMFNADDTGAGAVRQGGNGGQARRRNNNNGNTGSAGPAAPNAPPVPGGG